jgi:two-component system chemotaxis family response regulator WspR
MLAQRVVDAIIALDLPHKSSPVINRVSISVGGASCLPGREDRRMMLLEAADKALYQAKREGRNRAVIQPEEG